MFPLSREIDGSEHQISNKGEKLSLKKKGIGSEARAERMAKADADLQLLSHAEQERHMQKQKKRRLHGREEDVCIQFQLQSFNYVLKTSILLSLLPRKKRMKTICI